MLSKAEVRILKFESNINYVVISLAFSAGHYLENISKHAPIIILSSDGIRHSAFKGGIIFRKDIVNLRCKTTKGVKILLNFTSCPEKYQELLPLEKRYFYSQPLRCMVNICVFPVQELPDILNSRLKKYASEVAVTENSKAD